MQYSYAYAVESMYPYSLEVSECITGNNMELTQQATLLIRLLNLLQDDGVPHKSYDRIVERITRKLMKNLELWELYIMKHQEEYAALNLELETVIDERKMLHIKKKLGEICAEEYSLKLSVADWSIEDLRAKRLQTEKSINVLNRLRGLFAPSDIETLYVLSKNDYESIKYLGLESNVYKFLTQVLTRLAKATAYTRPSTL
jgi:hypothetical protein